MFYKYDNYCVLFEIQRNAYISIINILCSISHTQTCRMSYCYWYVCVAFPGRTDWYLLLYYYCPYEWDSWCDVMSRTFSMHVRRYSTCNVPPTFHCLPNEAKHIMCEINTIILLFEYSTTRVQNYSCSSEKMCFLGCHNQIRYMPKASSFRRIDIDTQHCLRNYYVSICL